MTFTILNYLLSLALVALLVYLIYYGHTKDAKKSLKQTSTTIGWLIFFNILWGFVLNPAFEWLWHHITKA